MEMCGEMLYNKIDNHLSHGEEVHVVMQIELNARQFRLLLDLVYTGNWVMNSQRGQDRIAEYDGVQNLVFSHAAEAGMPELSAKMKGESYPSSQYAGGGIHEAIMDYEDTVFFNILAEELARRDLEGLDVDGVNRNELDELTERYAEEFASNGIDNIVVQGVDDQ